MTLRKITYKGYYNQYLKPRIKTRGKPEMYASKHILL